MKIVLNKCYFGGFSLSDLAIKELEFTGEDKWYWNIFENRDNPDLVKIVEKLGESASGHYSELCVVSIPDNITDWLIEECDGYEHLLYVENGKIYWV